MRASRSLALVTVALAVSLNGAGAGTRARKGPPAALNLQRNLPRDPLLVVALTVDDPAKGVQRILDLIGKLGSREAQAKVEETIAQLEAGAGLSIQRDLLSQLGPQMVLAFDLPPIDAALVALQSGSPQAFATAFGGIGIYAEVREAAPLDRALRELLALTGGEVAVEDGFVTTRIPLQIKRVSTTPETAAMTEVTIHYAIRDGRIALGFSRNWIRRVFQNGPAGEKLGAGADFATVSAQLDAHPTRLTYVNLPKARDLVHGSQITTALLEARPRTRELLRLLSADHVMDLGLGSTSVAVRGGVRTTNFGPDWLAGAVLSSGLVAALAVPALIVTQGQQGAGSTLEDIRSIAGACEGFSTDTHAYPPAEGWVPVERIALYLEPVYIASLPRLDIWQNPLLYWSDGSSYRIISTGRDGRMDQDWSSVVEPAAAADPEGDIVFGDGEFLVVPSR